MSVQRGDSGADRSGGGGSGRLSPEVVGWLVVAVAAVIFVVQNNERTEVKFLFFDGNLRVWVVIVVSLVLGALLGWLLPRIVRRRRRED